MLPQLNSLLQVSYAFNPAAQLKNRGKPNKTNTDNRDGEDGKNQEFIMGNRGGHCVRRLAEGVGLLQGIDLIHIPYSIDHSEEDYPTVHAYLYQHPHT